MNSPPSPTGYQSPSFSFFPTSASSNSNSNSTASSSTSTLTSTATIGKTKTTNNNNTKTKQSQSTSIRKDSSSSSPSKSSQSDDDYESDSDSSGGSSYDQQLEAQLQWDESISQLNQIFNLIALPYFAKWAGRKWAYWMFGRYLTEGGFTRTFWIGSLLDQRLRKFTEGLA